MSHEEIETVLAIIEHAQDVLETKFEIPLYISLADHLHYTFQRVKDNIVIQNPLAWEVRKIFPKEYQIARDALKIIFEKMSIPLPEDEVASIALHIINAQTNVPMKEETYQVCKIISDVLDIVRLYFGNIEDEDSASYNRFVTHVRYFAQRVVNGVIQGENDLFLYEQVQLNYPKAFACSEKIKHYIEKNNHFTMSADEQVYLTIHINRLKTASKEE